MHSQVIYLLNKFNNTPRAGIQKTYHDAQDERIKNKTDANEHTRCHDQLLVGLRWAKRNALRTASTHTHTHAHTGQVSLDPEAPGILPCFWA